MLLRDIAENMLEQQYVGTLSSNIAQKVALCVISFTRRGLHLQCSTVAEV